MMTTPHIVVVPSQHFVTVCPLQKRVGSFALPAPGCAVRHEGEKHQESSDAHPQNQPEPRASGEKSEPLLFVFRCPCYKLLTTHTCAEPLHTLCFVTQCPKICLLRGREVLPLVNLRPFVGLSLNFNKSNDNKIFIFLHTHTV